jgi:hypothetical protein
MSRNQENPGARERSRERQIQAFELRKNGMSYRAIGAAIGVTGTQAFRLVAHELRRIQAQLETLRPDVLALELARLDALYERAIRAIDRIAAGP